MAAFIDIDAIAAEARKIAAEDGVLAVSVVDRAMTRINRGSGSLANQKRARDRVVSILAAETTAASSQATAHGARMPVIDPTTPAGAQFLASIAPREPRVQRDTGICNRCGYDRFECGC